MRMRQNTEGHDWEVKTLESLSVCGGPKLASTAALVNENFTRTTANNRAWATREDGTALADEISTRWLAESCTRQPGKHP